MKVPFTCAHCGTVGKREVGHLNRSRRRGAQDYCNKRCFGLARRQPEKPIAQKKAEKSDYDRLYRVKNRALLKAKKAIHHQQTYDPAKAAIERQRRMPWHLEYCRRPEYRAWKKDYDRHYRAKEFGEFEGVYLTLLDLQQEVLSRMSRYEIDLANGKLGKSQKRRREYESLIGQQA